MEDKEEIKKALWEPLLKNKEIAEQLEKPENIECKKMADSMANLFADLIILSDKQK